LVLGERRTNTEVLYSSGCLSNRFRKMLPELSGARSVAPQGQPFGAMSYLLLAFGLLFPRPYQ
jgi:hypothetical protein